MSLSGKVLALRRKIDELGLVGAVRLLVRTLAQAIFSRDEVLYTLVLPGYAMPDAAKATGATTRRIADATDLTAEDRDALGQYGGVAYLEAVAARLAASWVLYLVDLDGCVAGGGWALTDNGPLHTKVVPIVRGDVVIIDCFTFPESRGRNAYPHMLGEIAEWYRDQEALRAWIFTRCVNSASIRGIEKAGFSATVIYQTLTVGSREIVSWKRRALPTRR